MRIILIVPLMWFMVACSKPEPRIVTQTVYQEVFIPVACTEPLPELPTEQEGVALMNVELLDYTKKLYLTLKKCRDDK